MEKIVLGLSGGVDSAVSARLLLEQGYNVTGLFLDVGNPEATEDAMAVAKHLGIDLAVRDIRAELEKNVCKPFADSYLRGETPNPCIICNPSVKFWALLKEADRLDAKYVATGHYAQAQSGGLYKGHPENDQSYMLCRLLRDQVERLCLPLGGFSKSQVRELAKDMELPVAKKPDSMEICFIPDNDYIGWLSGRIQIPPPGNIVFHDEVIGMHEGIHRYTVGQRLPGLYNERRLYVSALESGTNHLIAALWEELFTTEVRVRNTNWLIPEPLEPLCANVKVRHTKWECPPAKVYPLENGGALIHAEEPLRAPARGQSAVFYVGERLVGSGFIV